MKIDDPQTVADVAVEILQAEWPGYSVDQFLCQPEKSIQLCKKVRERTSRGKLSNFEILWTLLNARKRSRLKASK